MTLRYGSRLLPRSRVTVTRPPRPSPRQQQAAVAAATATAAPPTATAGAAVATIGGGGGAATITLKRGAILTGLGAGAPPAGASSRRALVPAKWQLQYILRLGVLVVVRR